MRDTTPPDVTRPPIAWNEDGSVTIRFDDRPHRFPPLTLAGYAATIDDTINFERWLAAMSDQTKERRNEILAMGDSPDDPAAELTAKQRQELRLFNAEKKRNDVAMKQQCIEMVIAALKRSDPDWEAPDLDDAPQWLGAVGLVNAFLDHWETTPFRGRANGRTPAPSTPTAPTRSSQEADGNDPD